MLAYFFLWRGLKVWDKCREQMGVKAGIERGVGALHFSHLFLSPFFTHSLTITGAAHSVSLTLFEMSQAPTPMTKLELDMTVEEYLQKLIT